MAVYLVANGYQRVEGSKQVTNHLAKVPLSPLFLFFY